MTGLPKHHRAFASQDQQSKADRQRRRLLSKSTATSNRSDQASRSLRRCSPRSAQQNIDSPRQPQTRPEMQSRRIVTAISNRPNQASFDHDEPARFRSTTLRIGASHGLLNQATRRRLSVLSDWQSTPQGSALATPASTAKQTVCRFANRRKQTGAHWQHRQPPGSRSSKSTERDSP